MADAAKNGPVFAVRGLEVRYGPGEGVEVVSGVDLDLHEGRMLALVGESGCGKSVTAAAAGGLLPRGMRVAAGTCGAPRGPDGALEPLPAGAGGLAYVFQDPGVCLNPVLTVGWQLEEALALAGVPRGARRRRAADLLGRVGMADAERVLPSYPHQLSGGMQQRAMMAMALALEPRVLVADEPTTALDVTVQAKILDLLKELQRRENLAVLLITHNLGVVAEVADDVAVMYAGRIVERGPVAEVLEKPRHPYVRGLLRALPRLDSAEGRLEEMPGHVPAPGRRGPGCRFAPRCPMADGRCRGAEPPWKDGGAGRGVACFRAGEGAE